MASEGLSAEPQSSLPLQAGEDSGFLEAPSSSQVVSSARSSPACSKTSISSLPLPAFRLSTEYDSDNSTFFHKLSYKFFERLAKLKLSFRNNLNGQISNPQLGIITKYFSVVYDVENKNALLNGSFDVGNCVQLKAAHDIKARQGEVAMLANLCEPLCKLELASAVPVVGLPRAMLKLPFCEFSLRESEGEMRVSLLNGSMKGQLLNGVCTAEWQDDNLNFRYNFKDEQMTFTPSISLPSNETCFAFKRRFSPSDKLSYWYNFNTNYWSTVYKRNISKDLKIKAGYDSEIRLGWTSLWIGEEDGKVKAAPLKMKVQLMVQVPKDDIAGSVLLFRVKKRWDF